MSTMVAIMQPYFFPYIGYFQLIAASDIFVLHDDVQYIKGGWVNRNRILLNGADRMITMPVQKGPHDNPINCRSYVSDRQSRTNLLNLIRTAYAKAPHNSRVYPMVEALLSFEDTNVARFNAHSIRRICEYIGVRTPILNSSSLEKNDSLTGEPRVIEICRKLAATDYINPIGGLALYRAASFKSFDITLRFLVSNDQQYRQASAAWTPSLSILDVMMFNSYEQLQQLLAAHHLITTSDAAS